MTVQHRHQSSQRTRAETRLEPFDSLRRQRNFRDEHDSSATFFQRVRQGAEDYIGLQTLKAVVLAAIAWAIMAAVGLHNALFLAFLTLLVAYIPIVGPAAAVVFPTLLAYVWLTGQLLAHPH